MTVVGKKYDKHTDERKQALTAVRKAVHDYARNPCAATEVQTAEAMARVRVLSPVPVMKPKKAE